MAFRRVENIQLDAPKFRRVEGVQLDQATAEAPKRLRSPEFDPFERQAQEQGLLQTGAISAGRGLARIGRAVGLVDPEPETERQAFEALGKERPITTTIGEAIGESLPFAAVPIGAIPGTGARIAATAGLGALEGGLIARGSGGSESQQLLGAGLGGTIAGSIEAVLPGMLRLGGKLVRKFLKRAPKSTLLDSVGLPTEELDAALDAAGVSFGDLKEAATDILQKQPARAAPDQAVRSAQFSELGIPATKGDISQEFAQQATEARLFESAADPLSDPIRSLRLQQSQGLKGNLDTLIEKSGVPENIGEALKDALSGRKALLKSKKNALYKAAAENSKDIGSLPFPTAGIANALPDQRTIARIGRIQGNQAEPILDLLAEFGVDNSEQALKRLKDKGIEVDQLSIQNFDEFRIALNQIENADQSKASSVIIGPIRDALDNEADNLVETLTKHAGLKEYKGKVIDVGKLKAELANNSKLIGFIKKRLKSEQAKSIAPDTEAMKTALNERGVPTMQQRGEGDTVFADRIEGDFKRILKSDPILKKAPGQVIANPKLNQLTNRNAEITQIIDGSRDKIPKEIIDKVLEPLKEARKTVRQLKTEFSPQAITGKLIDVKRDGITPVIEASQAFKNIVGTNKPIELLERTITSLKKAGPKGVQAIGDLQAATVLDLIESAFKAQTRKVQGVKTFGTVAFNKRLAQIGDDKLNLIFSTNPGLLNQLKKVSTAAKDLTPPSGAVPKGSASVILDTMNKIGLMTVLGKVPGGGLFAEAITKLSEGQTTRKAVKAAIDATPDVKQRAITMIEAELPSLAVAFGLIGAAKQKDGEK